MLEGHGDDLYRFNRPIKYNFSSNVHYQGTPRPLLHYLKGQIDSVSNYPSPDARELSSAAGAFLGLATAELLFTNGATEAFYLIAQCFKKQSAAIVVPAFSEYEDACQTHELDITFLPTTSFLAYDFKERIAFFGNPNNPDGLVYHPDKIKGLLEKFPRTIFVIDEAYIEFTNSTRSCISLIRHYENLMIIRSLTKTFVIPGLRLGYIASSAANIRRLMVLKMPWSVNTLAIRAGQYLFGHYTELLFDIEPLMQERSQLQQSLRSIDGLEVWATETSYFLVRLKKGKASVLKEYLGEEHRILIRDATNFRGLDGEHIRLSVQSEKANAALLTALGKWKS